MNVHEMDDNGNVSFNEDDLITSMIDIPATDGNKTNDAPEDSKTEEPEVDSDDEYDSIVDDLTSDDDAGEEPEEDPETDQDEESEEADTSEVHTVKIDGEELEVSLDELKKGYGLQKSLTQKGQELAEEKKALEAEAQAIAWAKQQPEVKELSAEIVKAQEAIQRGFTFDENGEQVRLTQAQIDRTQKNVDEAIGRMNEMTKPPRLDELHEAIPEIFSNDAAERDSVLKPFGETLAEFGYSQAEIKGQNDPRTFFMLKELHELREIASRVEKAKARRTEKKPAIASKQTKAAKSASPSKSKTSEAKRPSTQEIYDKIAKGEANPADLFMD